MNILRSRLINLLDGDQSDSNILSACDYVDYNEFNIQYNLTDTNKFCILHVNCRSLAANFDMFYDLIVNELKSVCDVIVCSETWLRNDCANIYNIPGYDVFHHQRYNARGGGLCIYVRVGLTVQPIICSFHATAFEHFQLAIASVSNPITISAIYRPPNSSINNFFDEFLNYIEYISEFNLNFKPTICIAGDFNINLLSTENNTHVSEFLDIMYSHYLFPTILKPTRLTLNSATLIDNIFINNPYYMKSGLLFADISDHLPIFTVFKRPTPTQDKHVLNNKLTRLYFRNYSLYNVNKFTHILEKLFLEFYLREF
jgi:hypothetical protein